MFNFLLKIGAITIPILIGGILLANRLGFTVGIRKSGNTFTGEFLNVSLLSWAVIALIILEVSVLVLLYTRLTPRT